MGMHRDTHTLIWGDTVRFWFCVFGFFTSGTALAGTVNWGVLRVEFLFLWFLIFTATRPARVSVKEAFCAICSSPARREPAMRSMGVHARDGTSHTVLNHHIVSI